MICTCPDWEPCPCGGEGPAHCQWCCKDLTPEQLAAFNFEEWEHIPPRPKGLPIEIYCGQCNIRITNPTQEQFDFHCSIEHIAGGERRSAQVEPNESGN